MNNCIECGLELPKSNRKYCSNKCQMTFQRKQKIKNGSFKDNRTMRRFLIEERGRACESCKNEKWMGKPIPLEMDHIDGNHKNNNKENLKLLCPNCHAQTPTYKSKNIGNGRAYRRKRYKEGKSY